MVMLSLHTLSDSQCRVADAAHSTKLTPSACLTAHNGECQGDENLATPHTHARTLECCFKRIPKACLHKALTSMQAAPSLCQQGPHRILHEVSA